MGQAVVENKPEIKRLLDLSARLGSDPLLVQANSGNTSVKLGEFLWIKASGKWLADAMREEILLPVNLAEVKQCVAREIDPSEACAPSCRKGLKASVETAMHAVLPQRVVIHVHSVNTIAWAVRLDGPAELKQRLAGLAWQWIPYADSGLPLARAIQEALSRAPDTDVLVLANHGLVICSDSCQTAEELLYEVERRLTIIPRPAPEADFDFLARIAADLEWKLPMDSGVHALGSDAISQTIVSSGVLYPCQAMFLTPHLRVVPCSAPLSEAKKRCHRREGAEPFLIAKDSGVVVSRAITKAADAMLLGLAHVVQRIDTPANIRYLTKAEVESVLNTDIYRYPQTPLSNGSH